jgi:energy-coupling factor transporter ATP-binding protein EcfA2
MLEASNLECVRGERRLFAGVSFRLEGGEMLYLQGKNGSGKTSLLRMLCALTPAASGEIRWRGEPIGKLGEEFRSELCYLGHQNAIKEELTPLENLLSSANWRRSHSTRTQRSTRSNWSGCAAARISPAAICRRGRSGAPRWPGWCTKNVRCGYSMSPTWRSTRRRSNSSPAWSAPICSAAGWRC